MSLGAGKMKLFMRKQEEILKALKLLGGYVSGAELSRTLGMSRTAVWKHIRELRHLGYQIEASPHKGYRLLASPDKLLAAEIRLGLDTDIIGRKIISHPSLGSTMDEAFRLAAKGAEEGTVVCAESQTQGRGRMGRRWESPQGQGICFSLVLRPHWAPPEAAKITLLTAVAVCEAVRALAGVEARIKWPNDILIGQRKLAGILTEMKAEVDQVEFLIVGVGLNVNSAVTDLPAGATSLQHETGVVHARVKLLQAILSSLDRWYQRTTQEGFGCLWPRWKELSAIIGQRVRLDDGSGTLEGKAVDLSANGGLVIVNAEGEVMTRMSGDVSIIS